MAALSLRKQILRETPWKSVLAGIPSAILGTLILVGDVAAQRHRAQQYCYDPSRFSSGSDDSKNRSSMTLSRHVSEFGYSVNRQASLAALNSIFGLKTIRDSKRSYGRMYQLISHVGSFNIM